MRRSLALLFVVIFTTSMRNADRNPVARTIDGIIARPQFAGALWAIDIEEESGASVYAHNPTLLVQPASTRKLFVAATASDCLGFDATYETKFLTDGAIDGATLRGDLVVQGNGDPSFGGRYWSDRDLQLIPLLDALKREGISRISGAVVADPNAYGRDTVPGTWKWNNVGSSYGPRIDALAYNENVVGVLVDPANCPAPGATSDPWFVPVTPAVVCAAENKMTASMDPSNRVTLAGEVDPASGLQIELYGVTDPALYAAQAVDDFLRRHGIAVGHAPLVAPAPRSGRAVTTLSSPSLWFLLGTMLKVSSNLYAEMILKSLVRGEQPATYPQAIAYERNFLTGEVGIPPEQFVFDDGSGLSTEDRVSASALLKIVRWVDAPSRRGLFDDLMPIPGEEESTLHRRFLEMPARLRAKTGSMDQVNSIAGFVIGKNGTTRRYFAIVLNNHTASSHDALAAIDEIVRSISDF